jgi:hypothetical protein
MEALFSGFHVGDVGRVVGGCRGRWFGHFVVSQACGASEVCVCCQNSDTKKNPINRCLQGIEGGEEAVLGWHGCWCGRLGVLWTWKVV